MDHVSDVVLLRRSGREPELFGEIYHRHARAIYAHLVRETRNEQIAADITAETFAQAFLHRERFRDEAGGSVAPWLHGIAANLAREYRRHEQLEQRARRRLDLPLTVAFDPEFDRVEERDELAELRLLVARGLTQLPASQQEAIRLRVLEGLSYDEIGRNLGCSATLARVRVWRGLRSLRSQIDGKEAQ